MILSIETSTTFASVAIVSGDIAIAAAESEARTHSERLLELIDTVLSEAGTTLAAIDGIAIGVGPGSFTGLRIGMATAKGLCFAAGKPMWSVSSLAALALEAAGSTGDGEVLVPVLDARRKEVFAGFYRRVGDRIERIAPEIVIGPAALAGATRRAVGEAKAIVFGEGAALYADAIALSIAADLPRRPTAAAIGRLARHIAPEISMAQAAPVYIRKSEAEIRYPDGNPGGSYAPIKD